MATVRSSTQFSPHVQAKDIELMGGPIKSIVSRVFLDITRAVHQGFTSEDLSKTREVFDSILMHLKLSYAALTDRHRVSRLNGMNIDSAGAVDLDLVMKNELKRLPYRQVFSPFTADDKATLLSKRLRHFSTDQTPSLSYTLERLDLSDENISPPDEDPRDFRVKLLSVLGRLENFSCRIYPRSHPIPLYVNSVDDSYELTMRAFVITKMFHETMGVAAKCAKPKEPEAIQFKLPEGALTFYLDVLQGVPVV